MNNEENNISGTSALKIEENELINDNIIPFPENDLSGKKINENGNLEDTATKKTVKAIGRGVSAYFTKGESLKVDQDITNNRLGNKLIGVVSDELEKVPGVEEVSEVLDELNVPDLANSAMDTVGNALNGDISGTVKSGVKTVKETGKTGITVVKKVILTVALFLLFIVIFACIFEPRYFGNLDVTNEDASIVEDPSNNGGSNNNNNPVNNGSYVDASYVDNMDINLTEEALNYLKSNIPNWDSLDQFRKNVLMAAYSCVGVVPYNYGARPSGAGASGITNGLDCSGFVSWSIWTASGKKFNQTTEAMANGLGSNGLTSVSQSELKPGDFVIVRRPNNTGHALIYAGNNQYIHTAGKGQTAKVSGYDFKSEWTVYYAQYVG